MVPGYIQPFIIKYLSILVKLLKTGLVLISEISKKGLLFGLSHFAVTVFIKRYDYDFTYINESIKPRR